MNTLLNVSSLFLFYSLLLWLIIIQACHGTNVTIDQTSCINNITWKVNDYNPTVHFYFIISSEILSHSCLLYIYNEDFVGNVVYKADLEVYTNSSIYHQFFVGVHIGHPDLNKAVQILNDHTTKWSGHIPSWDMYISLVSHKVDTISVRVSIQKCLDHCYALKTPSIIPTHIINVPDKCGGTYCLDNNAVSYHIKTNFFHSQHCKVDFSVTNNPSVCITIGDHWKNAIIKSTKCRQTAIKFGDEIVSTFDRLIFKPWCLPWTLHSTPLSISWKNNDVGVSGQSLCTVTLYTNTSNHGDMCQIQTTTTVSSSTKTVDNTDLLTAVTVSLSLLLVLAIVIVYIMLRRYTSRQQGDGRRMVTNIHQHSSVCVMSPPPYSVAVQEESPCETGRVTINPSGQNGTVHFQCETTVGNGLPDLPPPYSAS